MQGDRRPRARVVLSTGALFSVTCSLVSVQYSHSVVWRCTWPVTGICDPSAVCLHCPCRHAASSTIQLCPPCFSPAAHQSPLHRTSTADTTILRHQGPAASGGEDADDDDKALPAVPPPPPQRADARRFYMYAYVWMLLAMGGFITIICVAPERFHEHEPGSQW